MAGRSKSVLDVREMLRRLRAGDTDRRIARELGVSRRTVKKYRERAEEAGWLSQEQLVAPEVVEEALRQVEERLRPVSGVEPWRELVEAKRADGVEVQALRPSSGTRLRGQLLVVAAVCGTPGKETA